MEDYQTKKQDSEQTLINKIKSFFRTTKNISKFCIKDPEAATGFVYFYGGLTVLVVTATILPSYGFYKGMEYSYDYFQRNVIPAIEDIAEDFNIKDIFS